jgi:hypothetical protein
VAPHLRGVRELWSKPMKRLELRAFLRVGRLRGKRRLAVGTPSPCFLQECDSIGVKGWGCAKNVILWELGERQLKEERFGELNAETQSAQRPEEEGMGMDLARRGKRNTRNSSRNSYRLSIVFLITELVFERARRKLKDSKELGGG